VPDPVGLLEGLATTRAVRRYRDEPVPPDALQSKPTGPLGWFGADLEEADFLRAMEEEGRLIYEFDVQRTYGLR
jgi:hypothetical protein